MSHKYARGSLINAILMEAMLKDDQPLIGRRGASSAYKSWRVPKPGKILLKGKAVKAFRKAYRGQTPYA
jgi:hypothetical protein